MNKKSQNSCTFLVKCVLLILSISTACEASVCSRVESLKEFTSEDQIESTFFDEYYIKKLNKVYYIYAKKSTRLAYTTTINVMSKLENYPQFMPGYKAINVKRESNNKLLTDIQFRPSFSPIKSRFTNQVEIVVESLTYKQCWEQLDENDKRVDGTFKYAPIKNKGYWYLQNKMDGGTDISYFSIIQPPVNIPTRLYKFIVKYSYKGVFRSIISRAQSHAE